jgi:hypothetical protein
MLSDFHGIRYHPRRSETGTTGQIPVAIRQLLPGQPQLRLLPLLRAHGLPNSPLPANQLSQRFCRNQFMSPRAPPAPAAHASDRECPAVSRVRPATDSDARAGPFRTSDSGKNARPDIMIGTSVLSSLPISCRFTLAILDDRLVAYVAIVYCTVSFSSWKVQRFQTSFASKQWLDVPSGQVRARFWVLLRLIPRYGPSQGT